MMDASAADLIRAAMQHHQAGRLAEALNFYDLVLRDQPDNFDALHLKGLIAHQQGRPTEAIPLLARAVELRPAEPIFRFNYGNVLRAAGRNAEAVEVYRSAVSLKPDFVDAYKNLANALDSLNRKTESDAARQTVAILQPKGAEAQHRMGMARNQQNDLTGAAEAFRRAIQIEPDHAGGHVELSNALMLLGETGEAIAVHRHHLSKRKVEPHFHSNLLLCLQYSDAISPEETFADHRNWARIHADPLLPPIIPRQQKSETSRLRIGYVSPDFRQHAVTNFFEPLLTHHDNSKFETICYSDVADPDEVTIRLKQAATRWVDTKSLSDGELAARITADSIDILIDLAGHTAGNRLLTFARKPAPITATYLGYPASTGMSGMDYRITDSLTDPPGQTEHLHTEKLIRLPHCFLCFQPPAHAPPPTDPPFLKSGHITFGSFNHAGKITPTTQKLWAQVLRAVPNSRLVLKARGLIDQNARQRCQSAFTALGIESSRIEFLLVKAVHRTHLQQFDQIDIALDTFPYNGTTTTCETLWMGIPVISLAGTTHVSRVGLSLLINAGLPELAATTPDAFVQIAKTLASNPQRLIELRKSLRDKLAASALMDAPTFTRDFENALQQMWASYAGRP